MFVEAYLIRGALQGDSLVAVAGSGVLLLRVSVTYVEHSYLLSSHQSGALMK